MRQVLALYVKAITEHEAAKALRFFTIFGKTILLAAIEKAMYHNGALNFS